MMNVDLSSKAEAEISGSHMYRDGYELCLVVQADSSEDSVDHLVDLLEHSGYGNVEVRVVYDK